MRPLWEDITARASGLASRLLSPAALARLAQARDLQALARALAEAGAVPDEIAGATAASLDLAIRRAAARQLALARAWLGARMEVVAVAFDLEDRRSLRALIRGAAAGVGSEARLAGLIPTPALPERLLRELAERSRITEQAALLIAAGHPYGSPILAAAGTGEPDLFALELVLARTFAARALRGARRGGRFLLEYVGDVIDADNCRQLLTRSATGEGSQPGATFVPGGRSITRERFGEAARAPTPQDAAHVLAEALGDRTVGALLLRHAADPAPLETALEENLTARLRRESRLDPLGPAPLLLYCVRLRRQTAALSDIVWRLDLGAPAPTERVA
jgi:vacuolar-type H+-ATPase subunit C/Vma6